MTLLLVELLQNICTTKSLGVFLAKTSDFFASAAGATIVWSWPKRVDEIVGRGLPTSGGWEVGCPGALFGGTRESFGPWLGVGWLLT